MKIKIFKLLHFIVLAGCLSETVCGETFDNEAQSRAAIGFGLGYVGYHFYKSQVTNNKFLTLLLTAATVVGASIAYDSQVEKRSSSPNTIAAGVGVTTAALTFNLFDGSDNGSRAQDKSHLDNRPTHEPLVDIRNEPKLEIHLPEGNRPSEHHENRYTIERSRISVPSREPASTNTKESNADFYESPGME